MQSEAVVDPNAMCSGGSLVEEATAKKLSFFLAKELLLFSCVGQKMKKMEIGKLSTTMQRNHSHKCDILIPAWNVTLLVILNLLGVQASPALAPRL